MKDKTVDPTPPLNCKWIGRGGAPIVSDPVRVDEIIDDSTLVIVWPENETAARALLTRTTTKGFKEGERFTFKEPLWFAVGETSHNGERIPVLVPIKK